MVSPHLEKIFFHNIIRNDQYIEVAKDNFFDEPIIKKVFPHIKEFWTKYKQCPTIEQTMEILKMKNVEEVNPSHIQSLWECDLNSYEDSWLSENTETFIEYKNLDTSVTDLVRYLRTTPVNVENIKEIINNAKNIIVDRNSIDFDFSEGSDFFNPSNHKQPTHNTFSTGYDYLDLVGDGGFSAKTVTIFMGAAKVGKCFSADIYIKVRSKKTGLIEKIKIKDFHERCIKKRF